LSGGGLCADNTPANTNTMTLLKGILQRARTTPLRRQGGMVNVKSSWD
jgi:hypothetical protein